MMEAVRTSETSVYSNDITRRYIPEDSKPQLRYSVDVDLLGSNAVWTSR
jgi:hypothetical protein